MDNTDTKLVTIREGDLFYLQQAAADWLMLNLDSPSARDVADALKASRSK